MVTQTLDLHLDAFEPVLYLPCAPVASVTYVKYYADDGALTALDSAAYLLDSVSKPARITEAYGYSWPTTRTRTGAAQVRFVAGYGADEAAVPEDLKLCIKLLTAHMFENREATLSGTIIGKLPFGLDMLIMSQRIWVP